MTDAQIDTHVKVELYSAEAEYAIANVVSVIDILDIVIILSSTSSLRLHHSLLL